MGANRRTSPTSQPLPTRTSITSVEKEPAKRERSKLRFRSEENGFRFSSSLRPFDGIGSAACVSRGEVGVYNHRCFTSCSTHEKGDGGTKDGTVRLGETRSNARLPTRSGGTLCRRQPLRSTWRAQGSLSLASGTRGDASDLGTLPFPGRSDVGCPRVPLRATSWTS